MANRRVLPGLLVFVCVMMIFSLHVSKTSLKVEPKGTHSIEEQQAIGQSRPNLEVPFEDLLKGPYGMPDDHPMLIEQIQGYLIPPSVKPMKLKFPDRETSRGQHKEIINILGDMKNQGFYIEAGALNGESSSNTLTLEKEYGWKGLLVEANRKQYMDLLQKQRKAWSINCCLSLTRYPNSVLFRNSGVWGKIVDVKLETETEADYAQVQCYPLYSILLALKTTTIDFFSLDIEGFELDVLKTIPWDKVNIRTLAVEFQNINHKHIILNKAERNVSNVIAGREELREYMASKGYNVYTEAGAVNTFVQIKSDFIFYRKDVIPLKPSNYTAQ